MKTDEILNLDCTKQENAEKIKCFLVKIKPLKNIMDKSCHTKSDISVEILEQVLHGISVNYGYENQGIKSYYEKQRFVFYTCSIIKKRDTSEWIGNAYGKSIWEVLAKILIKIYADILKDKKNEK